MYGNKCYFIFHSPVPCAPRNVSATLVYLTHSALVSWVGSAVGYNVTLTGQDGHTHHCQTNSSSCEIPDIHCGETYNITVTPFSETCAGHPSEVYTFRAGTALKPGILHVERDYLIPLVERASNLLLFTSLQGSVLPVTSPCLQDVSTPLSLGPK